MATSQLIEPKTAASIPVDLEQLVSFASDGLLPMFDPQSQLFHHRVTYGAGGVVKERLSPRYTAMTLLGLHRLEAASSRSPVNIDSSLNALAADPTWVNNIGDMGIMLWLFAVVAPDQLRHIYHALQVESALSRFASTQEARSMELAWLLTGLSHASIAQPSMLVGCTDLSIKCYDLLARNQGPHGFFGHQATWKSVGGVVRGRIGSFADQVYPIYGLTQFAKAHQHHEALKLAQRCAQAICDAQGALGQWWWHYDAARGRVFENYPVYSVHQHGMAPMALLALGDEANLDFGEPIMRGLSWIYGNNELKANMFDHTSQVVWRNIHKKSRSYFGKTLKFLRPDEPARPQHDLQILHECRPYELGWLLYAFAGRTGSASTQSMQFTTPGEGK